MSVKFDVQMTDKYMFDFLMYHTYTHMNGILTAVLGVVTLGVGISRILEGNVTGSMPMLLVAILFLVMNPMTTKNTAKAQVAKTPAFQKPLEYEFAEEGVYVRQDESEVLTKWEDFSKAVSTQKSVLLYTSKKMAWILPKACMGEQYEATLKMIHTHMPAKKVKIRHIH